MRTLLLSLQVNNSLISLKDEVHSEERRINETVLLTVSIHVHLVNYQDCIPDLNLSLSQLGVQ